MNTLTITGIINSTPELKETDGGMPMAKFSIVNKVKLSSYIETNKLKCIAYGKVAEYVEVECYDGLEVLLSGRLVTKVYQIGGRFHTHWYIICNFVTKVEHGLLNETR